jgi:hypothetical protein
MPGEDYYTDFKKGDPYVKVDQGFARLPGEGYAALHPELKDVDPEDYPEINRMAILADVAPYSREYNNTRLKVASQARGNTELEIEYEKILERVRQTKESVIRMADRHFTRSRRPAPQQNPRAPAGQGPRLQSGLQFRPQAPRPSAGIQRQSRDPFSGVSVKFRSSSAHLQSGVQSWPPAPVSGGRVSGAGSPLARVLVAHVFVVGVVSGCFLALFQIMIPDLLQSCIYGCIYLLPGRVVASLTLVTEKFVAACQGDAVLSSVCFWGRQGPFFPGRIVVNGSVFSLRRAPRYFPDPPCPNRPFFRGDRR